MKHAFDPSGAALRGVMYGGTVHQPVHGFAVFDGGGVFLESGLEKGAGLSSYLIGCFRQHLASVRDERLELFAGIRERLLGPCRLR
ncbi:hypothetical protein [Bradyrhizobium sp. 131]|uniref:hypothetical protein n=1 Tax=Bradyrhizobium sp. 131 TaxID=2782609 RepID=UPI0031F9BC9B